jgi:hypothetical protein
MMQKLDIKTVAQGIINELDFLAPGEGPSVPICCPFKKNSLPAHEFEEKDSILFRYL